ncbi:MAG TPA: hypothetical protein ENI11_03355 [Actinobacteria bacterium]|nr:hypothetical protein [Actinomycetota bacterium]
MEQAIEIRDDNTGLSTRIYVGLLLIVAAAAVVAGAATGLQIMFGVGVMVAMLAVIMLSHIKYAVFFIALYFPFEEIILKYLPVPDNFYSALRYAGEGAIYALFLAVLIKKIKQRSFKGTPLDIPLILFVGVVLVSALVNNTNLVETGLFVRALLRYAFLYYAIVNLELSREFVKKLVLGLIIIGMIQVSIGFAQLAVGEPLNNLLKPRPSSFSVAGHSKQFIILAGNRERGSMWGTTGDTVTLSLFLMVTLAITAGYGFFSKGLKKILYILAGLAIFSAIVYTYSRGTMLASFGMLIVLFLMRKYWLVLTATILLMILVVIIVTPHGIIPTQVRHANRERISPIEDLATILTPEYQRGASRNRLYVLMHVPSAVLAESPLVGLGPTYGTNSNWRYLGDVYWMNILLKTGFLGLAAFIALFVQLSIIARRVYIESTDEGDKAMALSYIGILIGMILTSFFLPVPEIRTISLYFWLFAGLIIAANARLGQESQDAIIIDKTAGTPRPELLAKGAAPVHKKITALTEKTDLSAR